MHVMHDRGCRCSMGQSRFRTSARATGASADAQLGPNRGREDGGERESERAWEIGGSHSESISLSLSLSLLGAGHPGSFGLWRLDAPAQRDEQSQCPMERRGQAEHRITSAARAPLFAASSRPSLVSADRRKKAAKRQSRIGSHFRLSPLHRHFDSLREAAAWVPSDVF